MMRYAAVALSGAIFPLISAMEILTPFSPALGAGPPDRFEAQSSVAYSPIIGGYAQFLRDYLYHFWDPEKRRIRPTRGNGYVHNDAAAPTFWHGAGGKHPLLALENHA